MLDGTVRCSLISGCLVSSGRRAPSEACYFGRFCHTKSIGLAAAELYVGALEQFGGSILSLPSESLAFSIFSWLKANFMNLPDFVGGAMDFGALPSAINLSKMLVQDGCPHTRGMKERDLEGPANLGATSHDIRRSVRHFMKSFWVRFG